MTATRDAVLARLDVLIAGCRAATPGPWEAWQDPGANAVRIRMALGAQARDVRALVVGQALRMGAAGLAIGLVGALLVTRVLDRLLFGVSAADPLTFAGVCAALVAVLLLAAYLPARRATRVDPIVALRTE